MEAMVTMRPMTGIFKRTFILVFCVFCVIAVLTSGMAAYFLYKRMVEEFRSKGVAIAVSIAEGGWDVLLHRDAATVQSTIDNFLDIEGVVYVYVVDARQDILAHTFVPARPESLQHGYPHSEYDISVRNITVESIGSVMEISAPILEGAGGHVHVGMDRGLLNAYFWKVFRNMQLVLGVVFAVCVVLLYFMVRKISRPLTELSDYAAQLAQRDFSGEISIDSKDELGLLARTMQNMAHELSALFSEMHEEVAEATKEVRTSLSYQSAIIDNLADGLLVTDRDGRITLLNPAMREFYALQGIDCTGTKAKHYFPAELARLVAAAQPQEGGTVTAEVPLSDNRTGKALASPIWLEEANGQCLGTVILVRDITHEKALDRLKTDFISTVSHELRTPMTSVLGFAKIIHKKLERDVFPHLDRGDDKTVRAVTQVEDNIGIIVSEAERLTVLINDVLDIAKMESGKAQWRDKLLSMADVVEHSVRSVQGVCREKGLRIETEIEKNLPMVFGDRGRLVQVVLNLLSNAIKFMDEGVIVCRVRRHGDTILTSIADQGVGILADELPLIFEKFKQVGDTLTEKPKGTGLGLPICKQIVTRHKGEIWAESIVGMGSTFHFTLPVARDFKADGSALGENEDIFCWDEDDALGQEGSAMLVESMDTGQEIQPLILVVDDDPSLGKYLKQLFREEGFRVLVARNGRQALKMASKHLPNLITMDLMMPEMDGKTAIRCLRSNPFTRHIPILVVTALSDTEETGGNVALLKPVDADHLLETANILLRDHDVSRSCIVVGERADFEFDDGLIVFCPSRITFCPPHEIWDHVQEGFKGFVFMPHELADELDLAGLSRQSGVQVLILPEASTDYK